VNGREWTPYEDEILRNYYPHEDTKILIEKLNRGVSSIRHRAVKLGIKKTKEAYDKARATTYKAHSREVNSLPMKDVPLNKAYMNKEWLHHKYVVEGYSSYDIAEITGVEKTAILRWLKEYGIERRDADDISDRTRSKISKIASEKRGDKTSRWNGGQAFRHGYRFILQPDHPNANALGYVQEHRLVMEFVLARLLAREEVVHHRDGNRLNNIIDNLFVFPNSSAHAKFHAYKKFVDLNISEERFMETVYEATS
jgi:hypothetical protein